MGSGCPGHITGHLRLQPQEGSSPDSAAVSRVSKSRKQTPSAHEAEPQAGEPCTAASLGSAGSCVKHLTGRPSLGVRAAGASAVGFQDEAVCCPVPTPRSPFIGGLGGPAAVASPCALPAVDGSPCGWGLVSVELLLNSGHQAWHSHKSGAGLCVKMAWDPPRPGPSPAAGKGAQQLT